MTVPENAGRLRIYCSEGDQWHGKPLYEAIVMKARKDDLAGATVLRGPLGYGANSRLHSASVLRLSEDLPMVVEIIDAEVKLEALLPEFEAMLSHGLITLETVRAVFSKTHDPQGRTP